VIYRPITAADVDAIVAFAVVGLQPERHPHVFSPAKMRAAVEHFARSERDFQLAAFDGERVVGAIAATLAEMLWFERAEAHVVMLYATVPGVGATLVKRLLAWADDQPIVRRIVWAQNDGADPRTARFAQRCARGSGFAAQGVSMQLFSKG
jgi:hypothetical protein